MSMAASLSAPWANDTTPPSPVSPPRAPSPVTRATVAAPTLGAAAASPPSPRLSAVHAALGVRAKKVAAPVTLGTSVPSAAQPMFAGVALTAAGVVALGLVVACWAVLGPTSSSPAGPARRRLLKQPTSAWAGVEESSKVSDDGEPHLWLDAQHLWHADKTNCKVIVVAGLDPPPETAMNCTALNDVLIARGQPGLTLDNRTAICAGASVGAIAPCPPQLDVLGTPPDRSHISRSVTVAGGGVAPSGPTRP